MWELKTCKKEAGEKNANVKKGVPVALEVQKTGYKDFKNSAKSNLTEKSRRRRLETKKRKRRGKKGPQ
jgi:hypothetical protein